MPQPNAINAGDTAFMLVSAALVMLMTPGLAFFYGGMVRGKNVRMAEQWRPWRAYAVMHLWAASKSREVRRRVDDDQALKTTTN
jgi:Ammonium Transporter Family